MQCKQNRRGPSLMKSTFNRETDKRIKIKKNRPVSPRWVHTGWPALLQQQQRAETGPYFPLMSFNSRPAPPRPAILPSRESPAQYMGDGQSQDAPHCRKYPSQTTTCNSCLPARKGLSPLRHQNFLESPPSHSGFLLSKRLPSNLLRYLPPWPPRPELKHNLL